jgi:hypothetical protein
MGGAVNAGKQTFLSGTYNRRLTGRSYIYVRVLQISPPRRHWQSVLVHNEQKCLPLRILTSVYFDMGTTKTGRPGCKANNHRHRYAVCVVLFLHNVPSTRGMLMVAQMVEALC